MDERLKRAIRRSFERAAATYDEAAFLQQEVARRLSPFQALRAEAFVQIGPERLDEFRLALIFFQHLRQRLRVGESRIQGGPGNALRQRFLFELAEPGGKIGGQVGGFIAPRRQGRGVAQRTEEVS